MKLPTARHERYLRLVFDYCAERCIGLGLLGSAAKGAASRFSDIDLALSANATADDLSRIAAAFETPAMGFFTVKPKGVLTVAYAHAFCVEIGVSKTITRDERPDFRLFLADGFAFGAEPELIDIASFYRPGFVIAHDGLRILYKAALKYLGGKTDTAAALLGELLPGAIDPPAAFPGEWKSLYDGISLKENIPRPAADEFEGMFSMMS